MRTIVKLMLGLAVAMLFGVAATTASAVTPLWGLCTKLGAKEGLFEDSKCTKEKAEGEYEWETLSGTQTIKLTPLTLLLRDTEISLEIQCFGKGSRSEGVIEEGGKAKIRIFEYEHPKENCVGKSLCEEKTVEEVKGINLPWTLEMYEGTEKKILTKIASGGSKEPGWKVKCTGFGSNSIECESLGIVEEQLELSNEISGSTVLGRLEGTKELECGENHPVGKEDGAFRMEPSNGKGLVAELPDKIAVEKVGGGFCTFKAVKDKCSILVTNNNSPVNGESVEVRAQEVSETVGGEHLREEYFKKIAAKEPECKSRKTFLFPGTKLMPGEGCNVEIELTKEAPKIKGLYNVKTRSRSGNSGGGGGSVFLER